jgi:hypothetical protein
MFVAISRFPVRLFDKLGGDMSQNFWAIRGLSAVTCKAAFRLSQPLGNMRSDPDFPDPPRMQANIGTWKSQRRVPLFDVE